MASSVDTNLFNEIPWNTTILDRMAFFYERLTGFSDLGLLEQLQIVEQLSLKTKALLDAASDVQIYDNLTVTGLGLTKNASEELWDYFQWFVFS